ncbi:hypothetical protein CANMA_001888 [Candida margitis]|uniref:uncharacterized protein n=1 Tax=Candida margitis TaxID=1775924 RepID=UPI0022274F14|nr:uncharacterized protein CANMA_001888 [Candida margitis]KAI5969083.1 hypothetical protein CANMA_001888 [Candida margitis]
MQFFKSISILALAAQALAGVTQYQFFVKSDNEEINGRGLYHHVVNEASAIDYYFVSNNDADTSASIVSYDDQQQVFFFQYSPSVTYYVRELGNILQFRQGPALKASIGDDGFVSFPGSDSLRAKKDIHDPENYSKNNYAVIVDGQSDGIPFTIEARTYAA